MQEAEALPHSLLVDDLFSLDHADILCGAGGTNSAACTSSPFSPSSSSTSSASRHNSTNSLSSSSDLAGSPDSAVCLEKERFLSGGGVERPPAMLKLELSSPSSSAPNSSFYTTGQVSYVELRPSDFPTPTDQISSSGESGCFDAASYTDLQAILDSSSSTGQQQEEKPSPLVLQGLQPVPATSQVLTPDATPEDHEDRLEWTYLEPASAQMQQQQHGLAPPNHQPQNIQHQLAGLVPLNVVPQQQQQQPHSSLLSPPMISQQHPSLVQQQQHLLQPQQQQWEPSVTTPTTTATDTLDVLVKAEPAMDASSYNDVYSLPVHLVRRVGQDFVDPSALPPPLPPPQQVVVTSTPSTPSSSSSRIGPTRRAARSQSTSSTSSKEDPNAPPRLCHVCGEMAGKHSYYGGQVCPSCRAFFRRSVQSR